MKLSADNLSGRYAASLTWGIFLFAFTFVVAFFAQQVFAASMFTATTVSDFQNGTSTDVTVTDIGGGNGDVSLALNEEAVDQSQTATSTSQAYDDGSGAWLAQTFTAGQAGFLTKVRLELGRSTTNASSALGYVTVEIRNTVSGTPGGTVIASATIPAASLTTRAAGYDFIFSSQPMLVSGTSYAIMVYRSGLGTLTHNHDWYRASESGADEYSGGGRYRSTNNGSTWTSQHPSGNGDFYFQTYYRAYSAAGTVPSVVFDAATSTARFLELSWNEDLPSGTDITFKVRASSASFTAADASPAWISLGSANSPVDLSVSLPSTYQYFEWQATLTGTSTATSVLHDVTATWSRPPPFRIFAGGLPRPRQQSGRNVVDAKERKRRSTFGLIQEYCATIHPSPHRRLLRGGRGILAGEI